MSNFNSSRWFNAGMNGDFDPIKLIIFLVLTIIFVLSLIFSSDYDQKSERRYMVNGVEYFEKEVEYQVTKIDFEKNFIFLGRAQDSMLLRIDSLRFKINPEISVGESVKIRISGKKSDSTLADIISYRNLLK